MLRDDVASEDEDETSPALPKRQPLSLEDMIAKKEAETQAQAKVYTCKLVGVKAIRMRMLVPGYYHG